MVAFANVLMTVPVISPVEESIKRFAGMLPEAVHVVVPLLNGGWKPIASMAWFSTTVCALSVSTLKYNSCVVE
jgi:Flp pilus assembly protein TadB